MTIASANAAFEIDGFAVLDGIVTGQLLGRLIRAADRLEERARTLVRSDADFVLEAAGAGGWVAWQRGDPALRGVLRSVSNAHAYEPELCAVADEIELAGRHVRPAIGGKPVSIANVFLWSKPPQVGSAKPWHQDMAFAPRGFTDRYESVVTVWLALDQATDANGCMEFVPGSHNRGLLPHVGDAELQEGQPRAGHAVEPHVNLEPGARPVKVPLEPGSAVMFGGVMLHRSAANTSPQPRRAVSFVYAIERS